MSVRYYPLINKMMTRLSLRDSRSRSQKKVISQDPSFDQPFITIAREPGSGGAPIAKALAEKLGFTLVDQQIIEEMSKSTKKRQGIIKRIDEKGRSQITDLVHSLLNKDYVDDVKYITELTKVILAYASQGQVVILGRGANFITPQARGLHVSITAPYATRVQRAMDYEGFNRKTAKRVIVEVERERRKFVKQYLSKDTSKANAYDLTINTAHFSMEQACDIIEKAFYHKFSRSDRYKSLFKSKLG